MTTQNNYSFNQLQQFIENALTSQGLPKNDALKVSQLMAEADLQGSDGHGIIRLPQYIKRIKAGGINKHPKIRVVHERSAMAVVDGDNGMGHLVVSHAVDLAIEKASEAGVAWVSTRFSNHAGPASLYSRRPLQHNMLACTLPWATPTICRLGAAWTCCCPPTQFQRVSPLQMSHLLCSTWQPQ
jgi:LDH2 family malate/lactate/ureidoglycolate dehydrogenase